MTDRLDRAAARTLDITLTDLQPRAVTAVLAGRDTLLVSPTGSGKSAVYQLAGSMLEGVTVVVSPLLALQDDQAASVAAVDIGNVVVVNAQHGAGTRATALREIAEGAAEFVLLGPEQLRADDVLTVLGAAQIDRLVIDEAHCIDA